MGERLKMSSRVELYTPVFSLLVFLFLSALLELLVFKFRRQNFMFHWHTYAPRYIFIFSKSIGHTYGP
jgi:hypothetical protein